MLFRKRKTPDTVFAQHYKTMLNITKASPIAGNAEYELIPEMFVICDFAAANAGKDRRAVANAIISEAKKLYPDFEQGEFEHRCDLYGEIIRGKDLRGDWFLGDITPLTENAVTRCTVLLGDILSNPTLAENYDSAPVAIYGTVETMLFAETVMMPLIKESAALFNEIYDL